MLAWQLLHFSVCPVAVALPIASFITRFAAARPPEAQASRTRGTLKVAARLQYGCTWINTHFMLVSEMPHGGLKRSGYGKDLSVYALEDYTVPRHVMVKL